MTVFKTWGEPGLFLYIYKSIFSFLCLYKKDKYNEKEKEIKMLFCWS